MGVKAQSPIQHFILIYDRSADRTVDRLEFGSDVGAALEAYAEAEEQYRDQRSMDIVLLGSDSLESARKTHPSYFGDDAAVPASELRAALERILSQAAL